MKSLIESVIRFSSRPDQELNDIAAQMTLSGGPTPLGDLGESVQFLNGVFSRTSLLIPAYYSFFSTSLNTPVSTYIESYPGKVLQEYHRVSSLNHIALITRKIFDHGSKTEHLNGSKFSKKLINRTLSDHAKRWSSLSNKSIEESITALELLRDFFNVCSKNQNDLLKENAGLCKKIGLIKQYANRNAAHLTLEDWNFRYTDIMHITASLVLIAEIIRQFGKPELNDDYFCTLNDASYSAVKRLYPDTPPLKLFEQMDIAELASNCIKRGKAYSMDLLLETLPNKLSYYWDTSYLIGDS